MKNNLDKSTIRKYLKLIDEYGPTSVLVGCLSCLDNTKDIFLKVKTAQREFIKYEIKE